MSEISQKREHSYRILLVEDTISQQILVRNTLAKTKSATFDLVAVTTLADALNVAHVDKRIDAILLDLGLPDSSGLDTLIAVAKAAPDIAIVVLTAASEDNLGNELIKRGAQDYLEKSGPGSNSLLPRALRYAIERKKLEKQIAERERLFQGFMENSPMAAFVYDEAGNPIYGNKQFSRYFTVEGESGAQPATTVALTKEKDMRLLRAGAVTETIEEFSDSDNTSHCWIVMKFMFEDSNGKSLIGGTALDVTNMEETKDSLRQSRELFRHYFYESPNPLCVVDHNLAIRLANKTFADLFEYAEKDCIDLPLISLIEDATTGGLTSSSVFADDMPTRMTDLQCKTRSGEPVVVDRSIFPIRSKTGQPLFALVVDKPHESDASSIAAAELNARKNLYAALVSHVPGPAIKLDRDGKVIETNKAFCEQFKIMQSQLRGRNLFSLLDFGDNDYMRSLLLSDVPVLLEECHVGFATPFVKADGFWRLSIFPNGEAESNDPDSSVVLMMVELPRGARTGSA